MPNLRLDLKDLDFFVERLNDLSQNTEKIVKMGMYDGAKLMADALRQNVDSLDRVPDVYLANAVRAAGGSGARDPLRKRLGGKRGAEAAARWNAVEGAKTGNTKLPLTVKQKNGLRNGLGIAPFRVESNKISTVIGFQGYNEMRSKRWPNGQPNAMIAASCNNGTSHMTRQPFLDNTYRETRSKAVSTIHDYVIARYREILNKI